MIKSVPKNVYSSATFNEIKTDLIDFYSQQDEFKDFDFEGSKIQSLVDLAAYAALYIQQYANAETYESSIMTARKRSSIVQHAQDNGYLPANRRSSEATVRLTATHDTNPNSITIPKGVKFIGTVLGVDNYEFVTWKDYAIIRNSDNDYIENVKLVQGKMMRQQITYNNENRLIIRDPDIDRRYMRLYVDGSHWDNYTGRSMVNTTGASNVYYIRETIDGFTEIYFGEGELETDFNTGLVSDNYVGGLKPPNGSNIVIEYIKSDGDGSNGSRDITFVDSLSGITIESIDENPFNDPNYTGTSGGGEPEDKETIRIGGQVMRETQRRAVTNPDYEAFVRQQFGNIIQSVKCFTDSSKPGYAFIVAKPNTGLNLTTVQREDIENYLNGYNMGVVTPKVIDPNYLYIDHDIKVSYKLGQLSESEEVLREQILKSLESYYNINVENFDGSFHVSKATAAIDDTDDAILGSTIGIKLVREVDNFFKTPMAGMKFLNDIKVGSFYSEHFEYDNGTSSHNVRYVSNNSQVDNKGKIIIGPFAAGEITSISEYTGNDFERSQYETGTRNKYYEVGKINYGTDNAQFNLGVLAEPEQSFKGTNVKFFATPNKNNIYSRDDTLIVFESLLRPEFFNLQMEAIV